MSLARGARYTGYHDRRAPETAAFPPYAPTGTRSRLDEPNSAACGLAPFTGSRQEAGRSFLPPQTTYRFQETFHAEDH